MEIEGELVEGMSTDEEGSEFEQDDSAGATRLWFGKHRGERLDEVPYDYRLWVVYSDNEDWTRNFVRFFT